MGIGIQPSEEETKKAGFFPTFFEGVHQRR